MIITILIIFICISKIVSWANNSNSYPVYYDRVGQLNSTQVKILCDTITPTTANGFSIDISSPGFNVIKAVSILPQLNTATLGSMPIIEIKSISTTTLVVNILTENSGTISILGTPVLSGAPMQFAASTSGIVLQVIVEGY